MLPNNNAEITLLYWQVGKRIQTEVLQGQRAEYGKQIIVSLSQQLTQTYGRGWGARQLRHCLQFAETFPNIEIVNTLCSKLSWSHLRILTAIDDPLKREFYIEITQLERWSVRQLQERINSMLFERTALSRKPEETIRHDLEQLRQAQQVSPDLLLKDPYILDFLDLSDRYLEKDLEDAILREIEQFLLELDKRGIQRHEYLTVLPPKELLQAKLQEAIASARRRLPYSKDEP